MHAAIAALLLCVAFAATGCDRGCAGPNRPGSGSVPDADNAETQPATETGAIGPQFWVYDLSEYDLKDHDVMYGLGGRWISLRYTRKPGSDIAAAEVRARVTKALTDAGWQAAPLPEGRPYVLSRIYETSRNDLCYKHGPFEGDPEYYFYNQIVHVSADGRVVACYYEVGW